jgi:hypothetical protein
MQTADVIRRAEAVKPTSRNKIEGAKATQRKSRGHTGAVMLAVLAGTMGLGGVPSQASAQWLPNFQVYTPTRIGLFGAGYTASNGFTSSQALGVSASGQVTGHSVFGLNGNLEFGRTQDAWFFDGTATQRIGLTDSFYMSPAGRRYSQPQFMSANGRVAGISRRFFSTESVSSGGTGVGNQDAWYFDGTTTRQIGFGGTGYILGSNTQRSFVTGMNASGMVIGRSEMPNFGDDGWLFDGNTTRRIGLSGGIYASPVQGRQSRPFAMNNNGWVTGTSSRYTSSGGQDAWIFNGSDHVVVGLTGDGYDSIVGGAARGRNNVPQVINGAGQVIGTATRYVSATATGSDAWLYDGQSTQRIGLIGTEYNRFDGIRSSRATQLNEAGQAVGFSLRYSANSAGLAQDSWIHSNGSTQRIGLYDEVRSSNTFYQSSEARFLGAQGHVAGFTENRQSSFSFSGNQVFESVIPVGRSAWYFDGSTTRNITPSAAIYADSNGNRWVDRDFFFANQAGQVAGSISSGGVQDAWYFDIATGQTTIVNTGSQSSWGSRAASARLLTDNGYMLGNYSFYATPTSAPEDRAFVFRPDLGFTDLGALVNGGLTSFGIQRLVTPQFASLLDALLVSGNVSSNDNGLFILIPSPGVGAVLGLGLLAAWRRKR